MPPFTLHMPDSLDEALAIAGQLQESDSEFDWVAGGTDLLPNYKWHINHKPNVISLVNVAELSALTPTHIGAMVRLNDLVEYEDTHSLVQAAAASVASVMIRRSGTVGGNICLDTRCFWFNQTEEWRRSIEWCHKCDCGTGADCLVIANQNTLCVATYQADMAPALMGLGAVIDKVGRETGIFTRVVRVRVGGRVGGVSGFCGTRKTHQVDGHEADKQKDGKMDGHGCAKIRGNW